LVMISTTDSNNNNKKRKSIFRQQDEWEVEERAGRLEYESKERARRIHQMLVDNAVKMQLLGGVKPL
jgi:hypothetical protein